MFKCAVYGIKGRKNSHAELVGGNTIPALNRVRVTRSWERRCRRHCSPGDLSLQPLGHRDPGTLPGIQGMAFMAGAVLWIMLDPFRFPN